MKTLLLLFFFLLLPVFDLWHPGLPLTHDGKDHVVRIASFYQNLQEGNFVPRWGENLNWGYGHPVLMFLYPLPSYLASLFHFVGFSLVDSVKLVFAVAFIGSGLTMYLWLKAFLSKKAAVVGAVLYAFAPYHFVDLYVRGALGELVAFIFPPLVLFFFLKLSQKSNFKYVVGGIFSLAGFILAHNAVSLMFLPVMFLYLGYLFLQTSQRKLFIRDSLLVIFFGFALSAFFWLPAFIEGKYTLRDIVTRNEYVSRFSSFTQLIYGPWKYGESGTFTVQIGLLQCLAILLSFPVIFGQKNKREKLLIIGLLIIFLISLFLMTPFSRGVWEKITLLQKFQFPWRFLFLSMFTSAVIGAFVFDKLIQKFKIVVFIFILLSIILLTNQMWHPKGYLQKPEDFYTTVYNGTTDTGESAPIWSVRFMEHRPNSQLEVISGHAEVVGKERITTRHRYDVSVTSDTAQFRENTLYFPGWNILVDGQPTHIEFQDANNRGVMTFIVPKGEHDIVVQFKDTKLRQAANIISIVSLLLLLVLGILRKRLWLN